MKRAILSAFVILFSFLYCQSQTSTTEPDTAFYKSYKGTIIARVFLSRKYEIFSVVPPNGSTKMSYHANTPVSLGLGFTYRSFSLSYSKGLSFFQSNQRKGATNFNDFQLRIYKRKWLVDAIAGFNRGFYLRPEGLGTQNDIGFYKRPDLGTQMLGLGVYRVLNDRRFTFGAALSQNAWQKKSAGTFFVGAESFYIANNADSSFAPSLVDTLYNQKNINKVHLFGIGPGLGYAFTLVMHQHYFFMGSVNGSFNIGYTQEESNSKTIKFGYWENYIFRLGTGYNSHRWNLSFSWLDSHIGSSGEKTIYKYMYNTGNYRLVYARRFGVNYESRRMLW